MQQGIFESPIQNGVPVLASDVLRTRNSQVEFLPIDQQAALVINEDTEFSIPAIDSLAGQNNPYAIALSEGKIRAIVSPGTTPIQVNLGTTQIRAQSGEFIAAYNADKSIEITAYYGEIFVTDATNNIATTVPAQSALIIRNGVAQSIGQSTDQLVEKTNELPFYAIPIAKMPGYQQTLPPELIDNKEIRMVNKQDLGDEFDVSQYVPNLSDTFGLTMNVGALTIGEHSYGFATVQPTLNFESFRAAFNIGAGIRTGAVIYENDEFNMESVYRPRGNFEWDFGTTYFAEGDTLNGVFDVINDVLLKIHVLEIFDVYDPFYMRIGVLEPIYVGNGSLVFGFTNTPDYPAGRQSGLYLSTTTERIEFSVFAESITPFSLYGGRFAFQSTRKASSLKIGLTVIADFGLSRVIMGVPEGTPADFINPANPILEYQIARVLSQGYLASGIDFQLPIIFPNSSVFNLTIEGNLLFPFSYDGFTFDFASNSIWDPTTKSTPGLSGLVGFSGEATINNNFILSYLASFQYLGSIALPHIITNDYDRNRLFLVKNFMRLNFVDDGIASQDHLTAIGSYSFGFGFNLRLQSKLGFSVAASYFLPATIQNGGLNIDGNHELTLNIDVAPDSWPVGITVYSNFYDVLGVFSGSVPFFSEYTDMGASITIDPYPYLSFEVRGGVTLLEQLDGHYEIDTATGQFVTGGSLLFLITLRI